MSCAPAMHGSNCCSAAPEIESNVCIEHYEDNELVAPFLDNLSDPPKESGPLAPLWKGCFASKLLCFFQTLHFLL